jgi:streptogramin lyase
LFPDGIAVDGAGNIYASDFQTNTVYRFNSLGAQTLAIPPPNANPNFMSPRGIGVDSSGSIYVADAVNKAVYVFNAGGGSGYRSWP